MRTRADADSGELVKLLLRSRRERGYSLRCEPLFVRALALFRTYLKARRVSDVRGAREADVVSFLSSLKREDGEPMAEATVASFLSVLHAFFRFLVKRRKLLYDPTAHVKLARREALPRRVLTVSQAARLMEAPFPGSAIGLRDRALLELLYGTGIRGGECARLDLTDVDLLGGTLLIRDGKGKKDRVVPLVGRAAAALEVYLRAARPLLARHPKAARALFVGYHWRPLKLTGIEFMVTRHARTAGLGPLFPHALRHSCAMHLLKGGAHVRHVQELLGHKSLLSTMVYTRVDTHALREVLERAHPRERRLR